MIRRVREATELYTWKELESDIEGASNIGALILLISAVLVSSIVAGVLINTVSTLREQADQTGRDVILQVSTGISLVSIVGDRKQNSNASNPTAQNIQVLELLIELRAGSEPLSLKNMIIQIDNGDSYGELKLNESGTGVADADGSRFVAITIRDPVGAMENSFVMSQGTLVKIIINMDASALNMELRPNTPVNMKIIPRHGNAAPFTFMTPSVYTSRYVKLK